VKFETRFAQTRDTGGKIFPNRGEKRERSKEEGQLIGELAREKNRAKGNSNIGRTQIGKTYTRAQGGVTRNDTPKW